MLLELEDGGVLEADLLVAADGGAVTGEDDDGVRKSGSGITAITRLWPQ